MYPTQIRQFNQLILLTIKHRDLPPDQANMDMHLPPNRESPSWSPFFVLAQSA